MLVLCDICQSEPISLARHYWMLPKRGMGGAATGADLRANGFLGVFFLMHGFT